MGAGPRLSTSCRRTCIDMRPTTSNGDSYPTRHWFGKRLWVWYPLRLIYIKISSVGKPFGMLVIKFRLNIGTQFCQFNDSALLILSILLRIQFIWKFSKQMEKSLLRQTYSNKYTAGAKENELLNTAKSLIILQGKLI